jgi:O-antigen ligase
LNARLQGPTSSILAAGFALGGAALYALSAYSIGPLAMPALLAASTFVVLAFVRPAYGIAGALLATPFDAVRVEVAVGFLSVAEAALIVVAVAWVARVLLRPETVVKPAARDLPIAALLLVAAIGAFRLDDPVSALRVAVLWMLFYLVYLQAQSLKPTEVRLAVIAFAVAAGILGAIGASRYLQTGDPLLFAGGALVGGERAVGAFDDPNYYASLLSLALLPTIALLLRDFRRYGWLLLPVVTMLAGLVFSLSRGAILAAAFGLLLLLTWRRARRVALVAAIVVTALTLAGGNPIVGSDYFGSVEERLSSIRHPTRESRRPEIWAAAVDAVTQHPVTGIGLNQFRAWAVERTLYEHGHPLENAHSIYLSLAAETGLVGLVAFLLFIGALAVRALSARGAGELGSTLSLGLAAGLFAFLVHGLTVTQIRVTILMGIFFMFAGMITGLSDQARSSWRPRSSSSGGGAA